MALLGVFKAIKMDAFAVDDGVRELFGKFDCGFLKGDGIVAQFCSAHSKRIFKKIYIYLFF